MSAQARPEGTAEPAPEPYLPWCGRCGTDEYLIIESAEPAVGKDAAQFPEISYTCAECDRFYGHPVHHSPLRARSMPAESAETEYLHCGEPMQPKDSRIISLLQPLSTENPAEVAEARLETNLLRCACGFQLEVPA